MTFSSPSLAVNEDDGFLVVNYQVGFMEGSEIALSIPIVFVNVSGNDFIYVLYKCHYCSDDVNKLI